MGNKNDGRNASGYKPTENKVYVKEDDIEKHGNADVKLLAKAYEEYSKDGLTKEEKQKLKKLDNVLEGAEFATFTNNVALVVQDNGDCFSVLSNRLKSTNANSTAKKADKHK